MQGFFQMATFNLAREPVADEEGDSVMVEYTIISRRSRDRAGLRYQRRGIDDDANVANFVETEAVMRVEVGSCLPDNLHVSSVLPSVKGCRTLKLPQLFRVPVEAGYSLFQVSLYRILYRCPNGRYTMVSTGCEYISRMSQDELSVDHG